MHARSPYTLYVQMVFPRNLAISRAISKVVLAAICVVYCSDSEMENFDEMASASVEERSLIAEAERQEAKLKAEVSTLYG